MRPIPRRRLHEIFTTRHNPVVRDLLTRDKPPANPTTGNSGGSNPGRKSRE